MIVKRLFRTLATLAMLAPTLACATGLDLSWDYCPGVPGSTQSEFFDCTVLGPGIYSLYGRFNLPVSLSNVVAMDWVLDVTTESASLPAFWHMESGGCNDALVFGSIVLDHTKPPSRCGTSTNPIATWGATASSAVSALGYQALGANHARILCEIQRTTGGINLTAGTNYFGFQIRFDLFRASEAGGPCLGCSTTPVCIRWDSATLHPQTGSPYVLRGAGGFGDVAGINGPSPSTCAQVSDVQPVTAADAASVQTWPNPFRSKIALEFGVSAGTLVRMEVFDVHGRRVRGAPATYFPAGRHTLVWDGRDDDGSAQAAGVYLVRLSGRGLDVARRVTRLH